METLTIIVPAYNEEKSILDILAKINQEDLKGLLKKEVLIIDDCSMDSTVSIVNSWILQHRDFKLIQHTTNQGKGAALHTGISNATGQYILIQDADLEYDPRDYMDLLVPILEGKADVVYGSRFMGGKPRRVMFFMHSFGNRFLTFLSNVFTNINLTDMETCYKVFKSSIIKNIRLKEKKFGFEPEVTAKIARIPSIRIFEVAISYNGRSFLDGKKIGWKDGFRAIYCILKYNIFRA